MKILLVNKQGETRWQLENTVYNGREWQVATNEHGEPWIAADDTEQQLNEGLAKQGIRWGDAVARLTKAFGIKPCSSCEKRRQILNAAREHGIAETLKRLRETL